MSSSCKYYGGRGARARRGGKGQRRAMALRDLEAQRKAQPRAALFPAAGLVRPVKRFADVRQRLRVHAAARILHRERQAALSLIHI